MSTTYTVDVIAGDGIGLEVVPAAIACVDLLAAGGGFSVEWRHRPWGSEHYRQHGAMMPEDGIEQLRSGDAVFLGAVGTPGIPDDVTLWGLLIPIRRAFQQYVNLRPVKTIPGRPGTELDMLIVRENVEGEYSEIGGRFGRGTPEEMAIQESIFTRRGIERVTRFAAARAAERGGTIISATKSNGIIHTMPFWDEVVAEVAADAGVAVDSVLIDALAARFVLKPASIDVVVASNLFGDILSDLGAAIAGSIGIAPSANLNPEREFPSLFEPVHGSAPDIAGKGIANPVAAIWSASMMLEHLGEQQAAQAMHDACFGALADGIATGDLGGSATTEEFTAAVLERLERTGADA
ncbi:isocitrate/isopropylmalate family dehydrogenase [Agrococcus sp. ARC_14]|uniref:isocitrate/isopropylmalate dehydrogenase family protein n=1 Tax=Agrococcus sp. ARC_14 TaxID=2919927 RepID=UPI001F069FC8|nr:isocitrate/isopropylmalate family dehydrogenase [Agrococcus sp. ARC_14]MCH1881952.1 isocitrate/isopropylmalate family dehydrogenase [Agrococcus sp. ARC_14]